MNRMDWEVSEEEGREQEEPTDLRISSSALPSTPSASLVCRNKLGRKHKPIPPPLDLSLNTHYKQAHSPPLPSLGLGSGGNGSSPSPKYYDKNLPLRKRWHSWSPVPMNAMNGEEGEVSSPPSLPAMMPLYHPPSSSPSGDNKHQQQQQHSTGPHYQMGMPPSYSSTLGTYSSPRTWNLDFIPVSTPTPTLISSSVNHNNSSKGHGGHGHGHSGTGANGDLQTPTPFYTPNEPSPKFMNSPIFSYSTPDTYPGPFSPMRASSLALGYPPPSSPFTNLSLNSPLLPHHQGQSQSQQHQSHQQSQSQGHQISTPISSTSSTGSSGGGSGNSSSSSSCYNMIPSTLLSPAPSQASTNSTSYEDLSGDQSSSNGNKSLSFFQPAWSIFLGGTKVRFISAMNNMDWYTVDLLGQSGDSLGFKGDYAPNGLEVRKLIVTSSAKERIQVTFCPVGDPQHPHIEVNCEPGHPFMVDKKGWTAVKPEVFQEIYGIQCQTLECGDVCRNLSTIQTMASRSPNNNHSSQSQSQYQHQLQSLHHHNQGGQGFSPHHHLVNGHNLHNNGHNALQIKMEPLSLDEKSVPISVLPQQSHHHHLHQQQHQHHGQHGGGHQGPTLNGAHPYSHIPQSCIISNGSIQLISKIGKSPAKKSKDNALSKAPKSKKQKVEGGNNKKESRDNSGGVGENKGRRPMNGFLLFAKDKRPELIQLYPGKDNRSISVLLGEAWQSLAPPEREKYSMNAKARAEEQKKIHPDCWKRKRSQSINANANANVASSS